MVKLRVNRVWAMRDSAQAALTTIDSRPTLEDLRNAIRAIPTKDPAERSAVEKALQATEELAQVRALRRRLRLRRCRRASRRRRAECWRSRT